LKDRFFCLFSAGSGLGGLPIDTFMGERRLLWSDVASRTLLFNKIRTFNLRRKRLAFQDGLRGGRFDTQEWPPLYSNIEPRCGYVLYTENKHALSIKSTLFLVQLATGISTGTSPFLHCCRSLHIGHLGWQHQCAAVIAPVEISQYLSRLGWLIFLDEMTCFREDLELIFACGRNALEL